MVAELRELGVELMVSIWPTVSPLSENYAEFFDQGLLVGADQGVEFQQTIQDKGMAAPMPVAFYDPTNPGDARVRLGAWSSGTTWPRGIRVFWLDAVRAGAQSRRIPPTCPCTPARAPKSPASTRATTPGSSPRAWPRPGRSRPCCCAGPPGRDRSGTARRCGPATSRPPGSRCASRSAPGLSIAISGIPWWTTDIGGFHGGDPA